MSVSFSYVLVRSVHFNHTSYFKKTFISTFIKDLITVIETQILTDTQLFYIIYIPSITYIQHTLLFEINYTKKKITPEKLIGIVCGSVACFFLFIALIINIIQKKYRNDFSSISILSSDDQSHSEQVNEVSNIKINEAENENIDNWL